MEEGEAAEWRWVVQAGWRGGAAGDSTRDRGAGGAGGGGGGGAQGRKGGEGGGACRSQTSRNMRTKVLLRASDGCCRSRCGNSRRSACSASSCSSGSSPRCVNSSIWPKRRYERATRVPTAPGSCNTRSRARSSLAYHWRTTPSPVITTQRQRVVGTRSAAIASDARNSRTHERSTARPSNCREYGVVPAPLSCSSNSPVWPSEMARPSPRWPPYWPAKLAPYAVAQHSCPAGGEPENIFRKASDSTSAALMPRSAATSSECATNTGSDASTVGRTRV